MLHARYILKVLWAYGATVGHLTPDQKVVRSNRAGLSLKYIGIIISWYKLALAKLYIVLYRFFTRMI